MLNTTVVNIPSGGVGYMKHKLWISLEIKMTNMCFDQSAGSESGFQSARFLHQNIFRTCLLSDLPYKANGVSVRVHQILKVIVNLAVCISRFLCLLSHFQPIKNN